MGSNMSVALCRVAQHSIFKSTAKTQSHKKFVLLFSMRLSRNAHQAHWWPKKRRESLHVSFALLGLKYFISSFFSLIKSLGHTTHGCSARFSRNGLFLFFPKTTHNFSMSFFGPVELYLPYTTSVSESKRNRHVDNVCSARLNSNTPRYLFSSIEVLASSCLFCSLFSNWSIYISKIERYFPWVPWLRGSA